MSMKWFWKHVLPGLLLLTLPAAATHAQTDIALTPTGGTAVEIDTQATGEWKITGATGLTTGDPIGTGPVKVGDLVWSGIDLSVARVGITIADTEGADALQNLVFKISKITLDATDAVANTADLTGLKLSAAVGGVQLLDEISVTHLGTAGDAVAVDAGANALTVTKNIIAKSANGSATAITGSGAITLDSTLADFEITGDLAGTGTLTFKGDKFTNNNAEFVSTSTGAVQFDGNVTLKGGSFAATAFSVAANKSAKLGATALSGVTTAITLGDKALFSTTGAVNGAVTVKTVTGKEAKAELLGALGGTLGIGDGTDDGKVTVAVNGANLTDSTNNVTFAGTDANLEIRGNRDVSLLTDGQVIGTTGTGKVISKASLTEYYLDGTDVKARNATQANVSDGFLVASAVHNRFTARNALQDRLISGSNGSRFLRGQSPCEPCGPVCNDDSNCEPCDPVNPCDPICGDDCLSGKFLTAGKSLARSAWVNYVGRGDSFRSAYAGNNGADWKITSDGVQVGADLYRTQRNQFGILFGYEGSQAKVAADWLKSDDLYVGFYGVHVFRNGADARAIVNYGWQSFDSSRVDADTYTYTSSFDSNSVEVNLELGKRYYRGAWSFRPVVAFDLYNTEQDATTESYVAGSGSDDNALVSTGSDTTQAFFRFGSDLRFQQHRFTLNSGLYYAYDIRKDELATRLSNVSGVNTDVPLIGKTLGREVLTFNVGGEYQFRCLTVFGGYQGNAVLDRDGGTQHVGFVGGAWRW